MIKRFPSRNQRSKGIKLKHVIQIIMLLGVCLWLIYQVKHNHDKKKEFDENDAKLSVRAQTDQVLKLGRKHLHPVKDEVNQNEKHEEEEEDENIVEDEENKHEPNEQENEGNKREAEESEENKLGVREQGEEENNHGVEEQEEDENKSEEMEGEGRGGGGGGDDEIDENDQEKSEVDVDHDEEFLDEEKEKEEGNEKENENSEGEERGGSVENHNTHEAREEHYKGDDASSAVAHDTHTTSTETFSLENSAVNSEVNINKPENKTIYSDESNRNQNNSNLKVAEGEDDTSSNATAGEETENNSLFNPLHSSYLNKTATTNYVSHLETSSSNMTVVTTEASNNLTGAGTDTSSASEQNQTMILSESDHAQNTMVNTSVTDDVKNVRMEGLKQSGSGVSEKNMPDTNSTNYVSHLETSSSNMTVVTTEASNNLTGAGTDTSSSSEQNKTVILSESDHAQNTMVNTMVTDDVKNVRMEGLEQSDSGVSEKSMHDTNSIVSVKTEHGDAAAGESSNPGAGELEKTYKLVATNETENNSRNSDGNESSDASDSDKSKSNTETGKTNETQNTDATEDEMFKGDAQTDETDETLNSSSANGTLESVEHDDSSDSHIHEDVTTDLDTLPDIRNEGDNDDETAAE